MKQPPHGGYDFRLVAIDTTLTPPSTKTHHVHTVNSVGTMGKSKSKSKPKRKGSKKRRAQKEQDVSSHGGESDSDVDQSGLQTHDGPQQQPKEQDGDLNFHPRHIPWRPAICTDPQRYSRLPLDLRLSGQDYRHPVLRQQYFEVLDNIIAAKDNLRYHDVLRALERRAIPVPTVWNKARIGKPLHSSSKRRRCDVVFRMLQTLGKNAAPSRGLLGPTILRMQEGNPYRNRPPLNRRRPIEYVLWEWAKRQSDERKQARQRVRAIKKLLAGPQIQKYIREIRDKVVDILPLAEPRAPLAGVFPSAPRSRSTTPSSRSTISKIEWDIPKPVSKTSRPRSNSFSGSQLKQSKRKNWKVDLFSRNYSQQTKKEVSPPSSPAHGEPPNIERAEGQPPSTGTGESIQIQETNCFNEDVKNQVLRRDSNPRQEAEPEIPSDEDKGKGKMSQADQTRLVMEERKTAQTELHFLRELTAERQDDEYLQEKLELAEKKDKIQAHLLGYDPESDESGGSNPSASLVDEGSPTLIGHHDHGEMMDEIPGGPPQFLTPSSSATIVPDSWEQTPEQAPEPKLVQTPPIVPYLIIVTDFDGGYDGIQVLILPEFTEQETHMDTSVVIPGNTGLIQTFTILLREFQRFCHSRPDTLDTYIWRARGTKIKALMEDIPGLIPESYLNLPEYAAVLSEFGAAEVTDEFLSTTIRSLLSELSRDEKRIRELQVAMREMVERMMILMEDKRQSNHRRLYKLHLSGQKTPNDPILRKGLSDLGHHQKFCQSAKDLAEEPWESETSRYITTLLSMLKPYTAGERPRIRWQPGHSPAAYAPDRIPRLEAERMCRRDQYVPISVAHVDLDVGPKLYYRPARVLAFETQLDALADIGALKMHRGRREYLRRSILRWPEPPRRYDCVRPMEFSWVPKFLKDRPDAGRILHSNKFGVFSWQYPRVSLEVLKPIYLPLEVECYKGRAQYIYRDPGAIYEEWRVPGFRRYELHLDGSSASMTLRHAELPQQKTRRSVKVPEAKIILADIPESEVTPAEIPEREAIPAGMPTTLGGQQMTAGTTPWRGRR
ncbi:hypothetical protein TWF696_004729 [Orbilia brochopaga]|uniref:Uncharacterized protein n=1 Tax=Orbilia brochopaga TaxID=3140254 RepID=A0AAV9V552_9PEZI